MSANTAVFEADIDTSKLEAGSIRAKRVFDEIGSSGSRAFDSLQAQVGTLEAKIESLEKKNLKTKGSFIQLAGTVTGLTTSLASAYFTFDNLDKVQLRVTKSQRLLEEQQSKVNNLQRQGKTNTEQYRFELRQLQEMQDRVKQAQSDLTQANVMFGLSLVTMATSTIPSAITSIVALRTAHIANAGATTIATGATLSLASALRALNSASPYLLAITAGIAVYEGVLTPLVKKEYDLDIGIQSNIQRLMEQKGMAQSAGVSIGGYGSAISSTTDALNTFNSSHESTKKGLLDMTTYWADINAEVKANNDLLASNIKAQKDAYNAEKKKQEILSKRIESIGELVRLLRQGKLGGKEIDWLGVITNLLPIAPPAYGQINSDDKVRSEFDQETDFLFSGQQLPDDNTLRQILRQKNKPKNPSTKVQTASGIITQSEYDRLKSREKTNYKNFEEMLQVFKNFNSKGTGKLPSSLLIQNWQKLGGSTTGLFQTDSNIRDTNLSYVFGSFETDYSKLRSAYQKDIKSRIGEIRSSAKFTKQQVESSYYTRVSGFNQLVIETMFGNTYVETYQRVLAKELESALTNGSLESFDEIEKRVKDQVQTKLNISVASNGNLYIGNGGSARLNQMNMLASAVSGNKSMTPDMDKIHDFLKGKTHTPLRDPITGKSKMGNILGGNDTRINKTFGHAFLRSQGIGAGKIRNFNAVKGTPSSMGGNKSKTGSGRGGKGGREEFYQHEVSSMFNVVAGADQQILNHLGIANPFTSLGLTINEYDGQIRNYAEAIGQLRLKSKFDLPTALSKISTSLQNQVDTTIASRYGAIGITTSGQLKQVIGSPLTSNDIEAQLDFQRRLASISA